MKEKNEIKDAAKQLFERYGYKKTSMAEIGHHIGLNKASLYHYFKNKEDLYIEVMIDEFKLYKHQLQPKNQTSQNSTIYERILQFFQHQLQFLEERVLYRQIMQFNFEELSISTKQKIQELIAFEYQFLVDLLKEGQLKGEIKPLNIQKVAKSLFLIIEGIKRKSNIKQMVFGQIINLNEKFLDLQESLDILFQGIYSGDLQGNCCGNVT